MTLVKCRAVVATAMVLAALAVLVPAQITFSRDWTGGKRAAPDLALDCAQFARLCRHFIHELKAAVSAEVPGAPKRRRSGLDDAATIYDEEN